MKKIIEEAKDKYDYYCNYYYKNNLKTMLKSKPLNCYDEICKIGD